MDFVDMVLRLEKAFHPLRIETKDIDEMLRGKTAKTLTAGDVYDYIAMRLRPRWPDTEAATIEHDLSCAICRYNLRGLTPDRSCPECGTPLTFDAHVWHALCQVLEDSIGVDAGKVRRESRLVTDLGASF